MIKIIVSIPNSHLGRCRRSKVGRQTCDFSSRLMFIPTESRSKIRGKFHGEFGRFPEVRPSEYEVL